MSLGDGYRVEVEISIWENENVLLVPAGAVFRHQNQWAVYRDVDGFARLTKIEIGHRNDLHVEVLAGLTAGSMVVGHPSDRVIDGIEIMHHE